MSDDIFVINSTYFTLFYKMLVKVDLYSKQKKVEVNAIDLIKEVKDALNLQQHITSAVYGTLPY